MSQLIQEIGESRQEDYRLDVQKRFDKLDRFCLKNRENLKHKAIQTLESRGCRVFLASNTEEVVDKIAEIVELGRIVTYQDLLLEELCLLEKLQVRGVTVLRTNVEGLEQDEINDARLQARQEIASAAYGLTLARLLI